MRGRTRSHGNPTAILFKQAVGVFDSGRRCAADHPLVPTQALAFDASGLPQGQSWIRPTDLQMRLPASAGGRTLARANI